MTLRLFASIALALTTGAAQDAQAKELGEWLKLEGFGTLAVNRADDPVALVRPDPRSKNGSRDGRLQLDGDSLGSLQLTLNPNGELRGVLQMLAKDDVARRYRPRTEWLYATWDAAPVWNAKLGRIVLPAFMLSDTRNVAYAQTPVRPPTVLYSLNPITNLDGGALAWSGRLADGHLSLDATAGRTEQTLALGALDFSAIAGLSARWHREGLLLRWGHSMYRAALQAPALQQAFDTLASGATACSNCASLLAERASLRFQGSISALGASYEQGRWQFQAEYAYRRSNTVVVPDSSAWYAMAAYRRGDWTPYLVLGALRSHEGPLGLQTAAGAPPGAVAANAAFEQYLRTQADRRLLQIGLRWDFHDNLALKLQLERSDVTRDPVFGSSAVISIPAPPPVGSYGGPAFDGRVNALSLSLDFVF